MLKPFDPSSFNFTKIPNKEILFKFGNDNDNDLVIVNNSPIVWGHSLLVTQPYFNLPQEVTLHSFKKAVDLILLSNSMLVSITRIFQYIDTFEN